MFGRMKESSRALSKELIEMVYFMRGAVSYHDALLLTPGERSLIKEFIVERLEAEGKKVYPNY